MMIIEYGRIIKRADTQIVSALLLYVLHLFTMQNIYHFQI